MVGRKRKPLRGDEEVRGQRACDDDLRPVEAEGNRAGRSQADAGQSSARPLRGVPGEDLRRRRRESDDRAREGNRGLRRGEHGVEEGEERLRGDQREAQEGHAVAAMQGQNQRTPSRQQGRGGRQGSPGERVGKC